MFGLGCGLIVIACNTASAVALRWLQQHWLPEQERWRGRNILGIIVPTIEAATSRPWSDKPGLELPAHLVSDVKSVGIFGTRATVESQTYPVEIHKRRADIAVTQQSCPELAGAIEAGAPDPDLRPLIRGYVDSLLMQTSGLWPDRLILGCTHYPLVAHLFREFLPESVPLIVQPDIVAERLADYLMRHPGYVEPDLRFGPPLLFDGRRQRNAAAGPDILGWRFALRAAGVRIDHCVEAGRYAAVSPNPGDRGRISLPDSTFTPWNGSLAISRLPSRSA